MLRRLTQVAGAWGGGGGTSGSDNRGPKATLSTRESVTNCLKQVFNIEILGKNSYYDWFVSTNGVYGSFTIEALGSSTNFTVRSMSGKTDWTRTAHQLGKDYTLENRNDVYRTQAGFTSAATTSTNYIALEVVRGLNDRTYTKVGVDALFIHEMGNLIGNLLGIGVKSGTSDPTGDPDYGQKLENCVFGGRVGLRTGRLGISRELE